MTRTLARRMQSIEGSGVRKMFELVATMEEPINLSIGQADYDAPDAVKEAAIKAIRDGHNRYTVTQGLPELNTKTLDTLEADYGIRPQAVLMTSGVSGGLLLSALALLDPGDKVLLSDPYFVMYTNVLELVGAEPVFFDLYPKEPGGGWRPDVDQIAELVDERTKAILINTPGNPTGGVFDADELAAITRIAEKHGTWILSDEIYSHFVYDGPFHSVISSMADYERTIVLGGFSKTYGIPGWRVGFAVGPSEVIDAMKLLQQYTFVCCPAPLQYGALAALSLDMSEQREAYRKKRDLVAEMLGGSDGKGPFDVVPSQGSFYSFPAYPAGMPEQRFIEACLERKILVVPGSAFSSRATHFRLSFAASDDTLREGLSGLREIAER